MYDINKRIECRNLTVEKLIDGLKTLPGNARVLFCGNTHGYIHRDSDDSVISIDYLDLDEDYLKD